MSDLKVWRGMIVGGVRVLVFVLLLDFVVL
jgi:hypothetical protein